MAVGFHNAQWAEAWLAARMRHCLAAEDDGCLFRALGKDGTFAKGRRSSSDMGLWIREALIKYGGYTPEEVSNITSHSMKDTQLCWLAKAGTKHGVRRLLGGHAKRSDLSLLEYSRDAMAYPLGELSKVLNAI